MTAARRAERIEILDALRGFALFGILLANILYWSGWLLMTQDQRLALAGAETTAYQYRFHQFFVDGKFYTTFSLLFGAGFALQIARLSARGEHGLLIFRRRVLVLLAIGLVHSWLIWDGDILTLYALLGLILPWFHEWRERDLLMAAALLIFVVPPAGILLFSLAGWAPQQHLYALSFAIAEVLGADTAPEKAIDWLARDDFMGWLSWVLSGTPFSWGWRLETWRIPKVLGIMLLGMVAGRRLAAGTLLGDRVLLRRVLLGGLIVGIPANAVFAALPQQGQGDWASLVGTVPMALAYSAGFVLIWPKASVLLRHLAPVGQMALTNYLAHSLLGMVIFYGIGFGLVGDLRPLAFYAVAICIFVTQVFVSSWWLRSHDQGPLEAFWRFATYGRTPERSAQSSHQL